MSKLVEQLTLRAREFRALKRTEYAEFDAKLDDEAAAVIEDMAKVLAEYKEVSARYQQHFADKGLPPSTLLMMADYRATKALAKVEGTPQKQRPNTRPNTSKRKVGKSVS
jgi:hypothetical protein